MTAAAQPAPGHSFPRSLRLAHDNEFKAVYGAKMKKSEGPLVVYSRPNGRPHYRLGLSVGRRVGTAPQRNRLKRLVREAFRLSRHGWPVGAEGAYDLIVSVREHHAATLEEHRRLLGGLAASLHREWSRREKRSA